MAAAKEFSMDAATAADGQHFHIKRTKNGTEGFSFSFFHVSALLPTDFGTTVGSRSTVTHG